MRRLIHIGTATVAALEALAAEGGRTFQDLTDEAIADLLRKHHRPVTLREMLRESVGSNGRRKTTHRRPA